MHGKYRVCRSLVASVALNTNTMVEFIVREWFCDSSVVAALENSPARQSSPERSSKTAQRLGDAIMTNIHCADEAFVAFMQSHSFCRQSEG